MTKCKCLSTNGSPSSAPATPSAFWSLELMHSLYSTLLNTITIIKNITTFTSLVSSVSFNSPYTVRSVGLCLTGLLPVGLQWGDSGTGGKEDV